MLPFAVVPSSAAVMVSHCKFRLCCERTCAIWARQYMCTARHDINRLGGVESVDSHEAISVGGNPTFNQRVMGPLRYRSARASGMAVALKRECSGSIQVPQPVGSKLCHRLRLCIVPQRHMDTFSWEHGARTILHPLCTYMLHAWVHSHI